MTTFYAAVTLTLTRWPWCTKLTYIFSRSICTLKMKFLGQGFLKLEHKQDRQTDRQTDRRDRTHYQLHSRVLKMLAYVRRMRVNRNVYAKQA